MTKPEKKTRVNNHVCSSKKEGPYFNYWFGHEQNNQATADHFKVSRTTIYRMGVRHDWNNRANKIRKNIQAGVDHKIATAEISNVKMAKACLKKEVAAYLDKGHKATGNLISIVSLMKYIDDAGVGAGERDLPTSVTLSAGQLREVLATLGAEMKDIIQ